MAEDKPIRTYLVIEGEPATAELLKLVLKQGGAQNITIARSSTEGLELAEKESPDLIIAGIDQYDFSGYELCKKLQAKKKLRDIPVLLVAAADNGEVEKAIKKHKIPVAGYLMLPFYPEDMIEMCHDALNGKYQWPRTEKKQDKKKEPAE
ncbi:MAG: response regulator [Anaerolineae bacterium]|nr:response regulator [Anaerolineae bacterium]